MSESNEKDGEGSPNDEFDFYIQFTKPLVLDLRSSEDKAIASAWVQKLEVPPQTEEEKKLRLDYLKLLLFVLQRGRLSGIFKKQPAPGGLQPFPQGFSMADMGNLIIDRDEIHSSGGGDTQSVPYTIELSSDLREFVAAQEIPNFGVQMYYAWSSDDAIHKWSLFDEDKFSSYILDKIKQLKDVRTDDKTTPTTCTKKPCDLSFTKNYTKSKVKSPEEIEKSQGRSYQTYVGLVGRMDEIENCSKNPRQRDDAPFIGDPPSLIHIVRNVWGFRDMKSQERDNAVWDSRGGFKDCDDDQDKCPRQEQRKPGSSKKCGGSRRCQIEIDEEYDNFLSGLSGHNSTQKRNCKCPFPHHRPDCDAHGKGVQPFEERNPRSMSPKSKPETGGCNVWPAQGAGGNKRLNAPMDQCEYGSQFSPVVSSQQRNMAPSRSISPIRNDMSATGAPYKESNRTSTCACPMPPCTCPCPRQSVQQNFQMDVPRATVGPSPSIIPQGSSGRSCGDRNRIRLQRPVNLMAPPELAGRSGEASASSQAQLHCYNPQYQNLCTKPQPTIKINQDSWYPDEEFDKKSQGDDRRKQKIAQLSKMIAQEAREEDELDEMFSSCPYKRPQSSTHNQKNFEYPQTCSSQVVALPQSPSKMRASPNQGKMRQQQSQAENICFDFGAPPAQSAPPSSNQCYSGGFQQPLTSNLNQSSYSMSPECKRKPKPNTETYVKSLAYSPQNQIQYDERAPYQHMQPGMGGSEGRGFYPTTQQAEQCSNFKNQSMNRPKSQSDNCQSGGLSSSNSNSGRIPDLASVFQSIKLKAEAHREKCSQSGSRRSQSGEPPACQRSSQSRSISPFPNQPSNHLSHQSSAPQNKSQPQSQSQSSGKPCSEAMAGGMMPGQYAESSQNVPVAWTQPSTYCPPQGPRQPMNYDTNDYRKEGAISPGKGMCNIAANPQTQSQSSGAYKSPKISQGPPSQTCQGPVPSNYQKPSPSNYVRAPPSTYQGPPPATCQGFQPQTCQGPPPSAYLGPSPSNFQELPSTGCQLEDEDPGEEEDEVSGPESLDECPPGSSTSAEWLENAPCEDIQPAPQQWPEPAPAPAPSCRRSPDAKGKECARNIQSRRRLMVTSTPIQAPFLADESTIPCLSPPPCNMDYQYEQAYGTYNVGQPQQTNQEAQFYPIFGNSDNGCVQSGGQTQQGFGGFMELQNETHTISATTNRRQNMLAAPMPDEQQFSLSQTPSQFNSCSKSGY